MQPEPFFDRRTILVLGPARAVNGAEFLEFEAVCSHVGGAASLGQRVQRLSVPIEVPWRRYQPFAEFKGGEWRVTVQEGTLHASEPDLVFLWDEPRLGERMLAMRSEDRCE